jgi:hypothetical protein
LANTPITTLDEIKSSIDVLNKTDEACKKLRLSFAYHNHDARVSCSGRANSLRIIFIPNENADGADLAWATKGGKDPVELFKQNPGRFPLWHVKVLMQKEKLFCPLVKDDRL